MFLKDWTITCDARHRAYEVQVTLLCSPGEWERFLEQNRRSSSELERPALEGGAKKLPRGPVDAEFIDE